MPCYLYTWHAYGSWMPDHPKGYVHWDRGLQPSSPELAKCYRNQQKDSTVSFSAAMQQELIDELNRAAEHAHFRQHYVATDRSHVHAVVSWPDERSMEALRRSIRRSLSTRLNKRRRRKWFSREGHAEQVETQEHFDYLVSSYLPLHRGWKWSEKYGMVR